LTDFSCCQRQSTEQQLEHIADYAQPAKWGRYGLGFFFVLFLLWAFTMPIDSGVPAQGVIVSKVNDNLFSINRVGLLSSYESLRVVELPKAKY